MKPTPVPKENFLVNFLLGGVSAVIAKTSVAPTERIKLILQTQAGQTRYSRHSQQNTGIISCMRKVVRNEGFLSLWKGNGINVIKIFPMNALNLALKDYFGKYIKVQNPEQNKYKYLASSVLSGGLAGACAISIIFPLDFARTRLSVDIMAGSHGKRQFSGFFDCLRKVIRYEGIKGCYNGISMAICGMFLSRGLTLGIYDFAKKFALEDSSTASFQKRFMLANMVTQSVNVILYPLDTVGRTLMMQSGSKIKLYKNPIDCVQKLIQREGYKRLYRGCLSDCLTGIGSSLVLVLYDDMKKVISSRQGMNY